MIAFALMPNSAPTRARHASINPNMAVFFAAA